MGRVARSRYRRVAPLAHGGMGTVELVAVVEGRLLRLYARKRLHPHLREDAEFRSMFMDEARLAGLVRHPNVTGVIDVGEDADGPYLVLEYVEGLSVARLLTLVGEADKRLPVQVAVRIARDAARGLHAAHEQAGEDGRPIGLVHRDVSPQNLLVGFEGSVQVTDFGIAKAFGNTTHTTTGVLKGSLGYMAPELLRFEEPDRRSDLFSLGVTLWEMLAGRRLYASHEGSEGPRRILNEPPPDIAFERPDVPAELVELLFEMLAKDRSQRPPDAKAVEARLEAILGRLVAEEGVLDTREYMERHFAALRDETRRERQQAVEGLQRFAPARRSRRMIAGAAVILLAGAAAATAVRRYAGRASEGSGLWAGGWHTCALARGVLYCWGKNNEGQLGVGDRVDRSLRGRVRLGGVVTVDPGDFHTCACTDDGAAHCWGRNVEGQLGDVGDGTTAPRAVPGVHGCVGVATGTSHSCALERDGRVLCWGANDEGQLGDGTRVAHARPAPVTGLAGVRQVAAFGNTTCAVGGDGSVWCWGQNQRHQLGDGTRDSREAPGQVPGVEGAVEVAVGLGVCVRRADGGVRCWGGGYTAGDYPALDAVHVAAGRDQACVLRRSGRVVCWGSNPHGALGMGPDRLLIRRPAQEIPELTGVTALAVGDVHACARHAEGISCWGCNETGPLGDGTKDNKQHPVSVAGFAQ